MKRRFSTLNKRLPPRRVQPKEAIRNVQASQKTRLPTPRTLRRFPPRSPNRPKPAYSGWRVNAVFCLCARHLFCPAFGRKNLNNTGFRLWLYLGACLPAGLCVVKIYSPANSANVSGSSAFRCNKMYNRLCAC